MSRIVELLQQRAKAYDEARSALTDLETASGAEKQERYDKAKGELDRLSQLIEAEHGLETVQRQLEASEVVTRQARDGDVNTMAALGSFFRLVAANDGDQLTALRRMPEAQAAVVKDVQLRAWDAYLADGVEGVNQAPELRAALQLTDITRGGYLQPPTVWVAEMLRDVDSAVDIRRVARVFQLPSGQSLGVHRVVTKPSVFSRTGELSAVSEDDTTRFGARELVPSRADGLIKVSKALLRKVPGIESIVRQEIARAYGEFAEAEYMTGSGAKPYCLGLFTASDLGIGTARDVSTGNTTTEVTFDGLLRARNTLKRQYRRNANWLFHRDVVTQIALQKDGESRYRWQPAVTVDTPDMIWGIPVIESEWAPSTMTTLLYVGMIADFSYYWIVEAMDMSIQRLVELYAANNQDGFRAEVEFDAQPVKAEAFVRVQLG